MNNDFIKKVICNYSYNDINHIFSIVLRAWFEKKNMDSSDVYADFELKQMDRFVIKFNSDSFNFILDGETIKISFEEIDKIVEYIYEYFEETYPIDYDYRLIDPIYFSLFFFDVLDKIINVEYDVINISDIRLLRYNSTPVTMNESERFKALKDSKYIMYSPFKSNLLIDTPESRLNKALNSVRANGYGYNGKYAIFYNDEPYIRDGQHRVSVVKYLYGDIDVKILRFYLKNNYFYK